MIKLTQTVQKGGCAAKIAAAELREILKNVRFPENSKNVLVDGRHMDDAGIIKVNSEVALVQTLDFFTPIVDSPYLFGQIAAANALSDVYAMGGRPSSAMAILAFPLASMDKKIIQEILQGASDKIKEAEADFVGGHSIDDDTLKFGLSVTGYVHPERIWKNSAAVSGDHLILTKPIGTGTATAALKRQAVDEVKISFEINSMCQLNSVFNVLNEAQLAAVHAATDITGFGLSGHAVQMARASDKALQIDYASIPVFENTAYFLEQGFLTKAHHSNQNYIRNELKLENSHHLAMNLICDPQTSGGLLLSVDSSHSFHVLNQLRKAFPFAKIIGKVCDYDTFHRLIVS
jgi:selenide, water dikinase